MAVRTIETKINQLTCEVCGHKWESKAIPICCAKCKTPYWNRKKEAKNGNGKK
jgi:hypothetical protein